MTDEATSHELMVSGVDVPTPSATIEVLYVDADAAVRETTRSKMASHRTDISVSGVGTVEAARDVAANTPPACLVVDPVGLEDVESLLTSVDAPMILYTDRTVAELDDSLAEMSITVVEKGPTNRGAFLAEKVISAADSPADRGEYALQEALSGIARRSATKQAAFLADDGDIVWASQPLSALVDPPAGGALEGNLFEQLTALCENSPDVAAVERFREQPTEPITIRTVNTETDRYLLVQGYRLPERADGLDLVVVRDVTRTAGRDARLALLELLTEQSQDGLYTLDERGVIDFCNRSFAANLGYEPEELRGEHAEVTLAPGELEKGQRTIAELLAADSDSTTVDLTFQRKDGTEREVSIHYTLLRDEKGSYSGLMGVVRDITERKERQRELERQKELFDGVVDHFPNGSVFLFDADGRYTRAGGDELAQVGLEPDDLLGKYPSDVFDDESAARRLEAAHEAALKGETRSFSETIRGRHYEIQTIPIRNVDGEVVSGMALAQNVTERVRRERKLEQTTERLELALEGAELGVWDWNVETGEVNFDERWTGMLGYDRSELDERLETWEELVHPDDFERAWNAIEAHFEGETDIYYCDHRLRTKSGEYRWIRDIGRAVERGPDGSVRRAVGIHQDITERKERQRELERQRDELATLAQVHVLIQDVIGALGSAATRAEIEAAVCERIVESGLYNCAWIGEREGASTSLNRQTVAGDDSYLDAVEDHSGADSPGAQAIRTGEVQVIHDTETDERVAAWRDAALAREVRSAVLVPLTHDDAIHGVLAVYANEPEAFSERAVEAFAVLGEMVGFAFTAVQNRQLLAYDRITEMEFESTAPAACLLGAAREHDCVLRREGSVDIDEGALEYVRVEDADPEAVLETLLDHPVVLGGRVIRAEADGGVVELQKEDSYQSVLLDAGVRAGAVVADSDRIAITVEAPTDAEPRTIQETLTDYAPGFELVSKRDRDRQPTEDTESSSLRDVLTDRQLEVLRAAYLAGYYEWPRDTTAEELSDTLGIASSTLHQHLRRAERNILHELLEI